MTLGFLLNLLFKAALVRAQVSGYVGEMVKLPSGANLSWRLSKIEWSIFSNTTWIATYHKGTPNINWFYQFKGRLSLNTTSGDLIIHNLMKSDAMEYSVDLVNTEGQDRVNKIKLTVRQHLQIPTIEIISSRYLKGLCWTMLKCSSTDEDVDFTWQVQPPSVTLHHATINSSSVGYALFTQHHIKLNCTSSRNTDNVSKVSTVKCDDKRSPKKYSSFLFGGFLGGLLIVLVIYFVREPMTAAWRYLKNMKFRERPSD